MWHSHATHSAGEMYTTAALAGTKQSEEGEERMRRAHPQ